MIQRRPLILMILLVSLLSVLVQATTPMNALVSGVPAGRRWPCA